MIEAFEPNLLTIGLLVFAAFVAGYIDTLVGGGGLITIPALMAAGMPPIYALGTNKLQAVAGSGTASATLFLKKQIRFSELRWLMLSAFAASLIGAALIQFFDSSVLNVIIPLVICVIAVYFYLSPTQSLNERAPRISKTTYGSTAVPAVGFYDGMFGPGTGSFFVWVGVSLRGQTIVQSTMAAKAMNFATNIGSLLVFVSFGKVLWLVGLLMMLGQIAGASLGARSLMTLDPKLLRYLVIAMCLIILVAWAFT